MDQYESENILEINDYDFSEENTPVKNPSDEKEIKKMKFNNAKLNGENNVWFRLGEIKKEFPELVDVYIKEEDGAISTNSLNLRDETKLSDIDITITAKFADSLELKVLTIFNSVTIIASVISKEIQDKLEENTKEINEKISEINEEIKTNKLYELEEKLYKVSSLMNKIKNKETLMYYLSKEDGSYIFDFLKRISKLKPGFETKFYISEKEIIGKSQKFILGNLSILYEIER